MSQVVRASFGICGRSLCAALIAAIPVQVLGADIPCDQSPITYDISRYPDVEVSCDRTFMDPKEYDAAAAKSGEFIAFLEVFFPRNALIFQHRLGGDSQHYSVIFLSVTKSPRGLTREKIHAAVEGLARMSLFANEPGKITWESQSRVSGYDIEFYQSDEPVTMFGGGLSECLFLSRPLDGSVPSHTQRILDITARLARSLLMKQRRRPSLREFNIALSLRISTVLS